MSNRRRLQLFSVPKGPKENEIWYTTTDGQPITPSEFTILSNTYEGGIGKIVTSGKITSIPNSAFLNKTTLSSISMVWENITSISSQAFRGCSNLHQDFHFANLISLITINATANQFYGSGITGFDAPLLTSIPNSCFYGCSSLKSVNIPLATNIGPSSFRDCSKLEEINMESVVTIQNFAFHSCSALHQDLYLPKLTSMPVSGVNAKQFYDSGITGFDAPILTSVPQDAFCACSSLIFVNIPSVTKLGSSAFRNCTKLKTICIENVISIDDYCFSSCASLLNVSCPSSISISQRVFEGCSSIIEVNIPLANSIVSWLFVNCGKLTKVICAPENISGAPFRGCNKLTTVIIYRETPPTAASDAFGSLPSVTHFYVPDSAVDTYKAASGWSTYASRIHPMSELLG